VTRGLVLLTGLILARALDPGAFGEFSYAFGVALVAGFLVDLGLAALVIRDVSAEPEEAPGLLSAYLLAQALLAAGTWLLVSALAVSGVIGGPASERAIVIAVGAICVGGMSRPFEAVLTGRGKAHLVTVSRSIRGGALLAGTLVLALVDPSIDGFLLVWVGAEAVGAVAVAALCFARATRPRAATARAAALRRLLKLAIPFALVTAMNVLYLRVDLLMLGHLDTAVAVGNYAVASRVLDAALIIPGFFGNAFLATIAQTGARSERGRVQATEAMRWIVLLTAPLGLVMAVAAVPIVRVVAGGGYESADEALVLLAPVVGLAATYGVLSSLQVALDQVSLLVKLFALGFLVKLALNAYAIPAYGIRGAAVTSVVAELVVAALQWRLARRWFDARRAGSLIARIALATAAAVGVALLVATVIPSAVAALAGFAAYPALAVAVGAISRDETRAAWAAVRRRPA